MQIFKNRPLALAMCLFALSSVLFMKIHTAWKLALLIVFLLVFLSILFLVWIKGRRSRSMLLSLLCLFFVSLSILSSFSFFNIRYAEIQKKNGLQRVAQGYVLERVSTESFYSSFRVRFTSLDGEKTNVKGILEMDSLSALQVGDSFVVEGVQGRRLEESSLEEELYNLADGCLLTLSCSSLDQLQIPEEPNRSPEVQLSKWNLRLSYFLQSRIGGHGFSAALLLGNRSWIPDDAALAFRRSGISHLLALSGLHVSILVGFLGILLRFIHAPRWMKLLFMPLFSLFYLALTGGSVSTSRAVLMLCVLYCGLLLLRPYDSFTSLCTALTVILLITPYAVYDISMWLSFLAAASIIVFFPVVSHALEQLKERWMAPKLLYRISSSAVAAVAVGLITNIALLMLSATAFGEISLASVPATLILSVPVTLLIIGALLLTIFPFLPILPRMCEALEELIYQTVSFFSEIEGVLLPMVAPSLGLLLLLLTASILLLAVKKIQTKWLYLALVLVCVLTVSVAWASVHLPVQPEPDVTVIQTGKGDARLYTQNGTAVLVRDKGVLSGSYAVKQAALAESCSEIQDLIFYRYDNQGTYFIAKLSSRIRVQRLHLPMPTTEREEAIAARLSQEAQLHGIEVLYDSAGFAAAFP